MPMPPAPSRGHGQEDDNHPPEAVDAQLPRPTIAVKTKPTEQQVWRKDASDEYDVVCHRQLPCNRAHGREANTQQ